MLRRSAILWVWLCIWTFAARADQVLLKNGDRLSGAIEKSDGKTLTLKTDYAGEVSVQWDAVTGIVSAEPVTLELKNGQMLTGKVTSEDGNWAVETANRGSVPTPRSDVAAVRSAEAQKEWERLQHPRLTDLWSGLLDTGLSETRGNSALLAFNLSGKAARVAPRDKLSLYASVFGGGLGFHVIKTDSTTFNVFAGGDYEREKFSSNPPLVLTALTRNTAEIVAGEELNWKLNKRATVSEQFSVFPNMSDVGQYRFQFDATAATKLKNWLSWQVTVADRYLSDPLPGLKTNDELLSTGLRLTFGKGAF